MKFVNLSLGVDLCYEHDRVGIERLLVTQSRVLLQPLVLLQRRILYFLHLGQFNVIVLFILHNTSETVLKCPQNHRPAA